MRDRLALESLSESIRHVTDPPVAGRNRSNASKKRLFSRVRMTGLHPSPPIFIVL